MPPELLLALSQIPHLDAAETVFAARALLDLEAEVQRTPREAPMADILVPLDTSVDPGATHWGYRRMDSVGQARPLGTKAGDMPYVEVAEVETLVPMHPYGLGYHLTIDEIRAARKAGRPLEPEKALACRDGHYASRDELVMLGNTQLGIPGFVNAAGVPVGNVTNGTWSSASADDMIEDILDEIQAVKDLSRGVYTPLDIVLPPSAWNRLSRARIANTSETALAYLQKVRPGLKFYESYHLVGAGVGGADRMVTYLRDQRILVQKTSVLFETLPPQPFDQLIKVPGLGKVGGVHWRVPIAAKYGDGL